MRHDGIADAQDDLELPCRKWAGRSSSDDVGSSGSSSGGGGRNNDMDDEIPF
jgi:hypothetical protein